MITLDNLKTHSALSLLESYSGINPYLIKLKNEYKKNGKISLTDNQSRYILDNHDREPQLINRVINITKYLGEELKKQENLSFIPERILIEFILADTDKTYHVYGKLKKNQSESKMYWLPKTQVLDDVYFEPINVEVDFSKYNDILAKFNRQLYGYQETGVKFLLSKNRSILGDFMGTGKSLQSIVAALESGANKILVVCPSSLKLNWKKEIEFFTDKVCIVDGNEWKTNKFTIINYDILKNFHTIDCKKDELINRELVNEKFDLIILDEANYVKSTDSIRSKIISELCIKFNTDVKLWLLTGTPISNKVKDFYNLLKLIKSSIADDWLFYIKRYCNAKKMFRTLKNGKKRLIWIADGASNLEELSNKTKNVILRRLPSEVLDLPDKIITPVYQELSKSSWKKYNKLWDDYLDKREVEGKSINISRDLTELVLLRKFIAMEAIPYTIELVENAIEEGRKVIIFTCFSEELEELYKHFGNICVKHNGLMSTKEKQKSVDDFQNNDNIKVFVGNIISAGVGLTLTSASVTIFNSYSWSPSDNSQAECRNHRIGQENKVTIYYQLFVDTISIRVWDMLQSKNRDIATILDENYVIENLLH